MNIGDKVKVIQDSWEPTSDYIGMTGIIVGEDLDPLTPYNLMEWRRKIFRNMIYNGYGPH